jgi:acyl-coenzyme A thioesterase PaaI-like protein
VVGPDVLTAGYTINVLAPVLGDRLLARAWVISAGRRLIVCRCELIEPHPEGDRLSAIAQGTIARTT